MVLQRFFGNYWTILNTNQIIKVVVFILIQISIIVSFYTYIENQSKHNRDALELKLLQKNTTLRGNLIRLFDTVDMVLDDIKSDLAKKESDGWNSSDWYTYLRSITLRSLPILSYVVVYSDRGLPKGSSLSNPPKMVDVSDRAYFNASKIGKPKVYYGPLLGRLSDIWTYALVRRLENGKGAFDGIILGGLSIPYLSEFCKDVSTDQGIQTFILNAEDHILMQCEFNNIVIDKTDRDFYTTITGGEFSNVTTSTFTSRHESPNWLLFASELPNGSGLKIVTLISKNTVKDTLSALQLENNMFMYYILIAELGCILLYMNAIFNTIERRKNNTKIKVLQSTDYRQDDIIVKLPESGTLE